MKTHLFASLILATSMALAAAPALSQPAPAQDVITDYSSALTVVSGDSEHAFSVEIADDEDAIATGMMFRGSMAETEGMLFDLGAPRVPAFWMENTLISLDMLFIATDGEVLAIAHNAAPLSQRRISPGVPVKAVLELKGGQAETLGLKPGDTVRHPVLGNAG